MLAVVAHLACAIHSTACHAQLPGNLLLRRDSHCCKQPWCLCAGMSLPSPVGSARFGRTSSLHGFRHRLNASLQQSGLLQSASLLQSGSMREATAGLTATACWAQSDRQPAPQELVHRRITGDGRCLFRALAQGDYRLATGGAELPLAQETSRADKIRDQVICPRGNNFRTSTCIMHCPASQCQKARTLLMNASYPVLCPADLRRDAEQTG